MNLLLSSAKKTLIFFNPQFGQIQDFSFRLRPCGYHIYTSLGWEMSVYPVPPQGKAQFSPLDQQFLAVIARQGKRQSRTQALLGGCQGFREDRIGPGGKGDYFSESALSEGLQRSLNSKQMSSEEGPKYFFFST